MAKQNVTITMDAGQLGYWDAVAAEDDRTRAYVIGKVLEAHRFSHPVKYLVVGEPSAANADHSTSPATSAKRPRRRPAAKAAPGKGGAAAVKEGGDETPTVS